MTKQEYIENRDNLLAEAKAMLQEGKIEDANGKIAEAENLKTQYEEEAKAMANIEALEGQAPIDQAPAQVAPVQAMTGVINTADEDPTNSMEYRNAFMNYVLHGVQMPKNATTVTTGAGAVIPQTVIDKVIQKMEAYGNILPLITRTAYKGGVSIPTTLVKPTASWVAERGDATSVAYTTSSITFGYYKLKVKVAISLEMDVMALSAFERMIVDNISEAMTKALETAIINGTGTGQPKGILTETPATGQATTTAATGKIQYKDLIAAESALPMAYESGAVWCMAKKTFLSIIGMEDTAGQPIARVNYGLDGKPERTLLGRRVVLNDNVAVAAGSVVAFIFNFKDYVLNTNLGMTVNEYTDYDTDDKVTQAVMLADGKVIDVNSLVTMTLKAGA